MRIAVFGGTFDPIHLGHLRIAQRVRDRFQLAQIVFITAARPPHKSGLPLTGGCDRHAMVSLALRGERKFIPSTLELNVTEKKNYTIDTLRKIRRSLRASDELFLILGADQFKEFRTWYRSDALLKQVALIVISRPGWRIRSLVEDADPGLAEAVTIVETTRSQRSRTHRRLPARPPAIYVVSDIKIDISSTSIRAKIKAGKSVRGCLDPLVIDYIRRNHLYR
ncbi:MAG: nicotinate-nucleotide adenylyltransferase [Acidobacteriia bacterium]|nr:nicotinate-nucleotide adenylyltransferase [Terriglobia bacterium]